MSGPIVNGHIVGCKSAVTKDEGDCDCFSLHRAAVIEECALELVIGLMSAVAAIRALKDKP